MTDANRRKRNVTLKDVANHAGVSTTLVSNIINKTPVTIPKKTREKVLRAIEELQYVPSAMGRGLRSQKTHVIAQLILHYKPTDMLADPCLAGKTAALIDYLVLRGYYHLTYPVPEGEAYGREVLTFLKSHRVDGFIIENSLEADPLIELISRAGLPFVAYNQPSPPCEGSAVVNMDDEAGIRLTTEHLIERGHTRIGFLQGRIASWCDRKRLETFKAVLREHGLPLVEDWIRGDGSCSIEDGFRSTGEMLDLPDSPTAIAATSDLLALGALSQARSRGMRVPEDVALIGFDDIPTASLVSPPLSTVALSYSRIGELAGEQVLKLIKEPSLRPDPVTVPVRLVERASTATVR